MATSLSECIRDGTFPDSNEVLSADVTSDSISALLDSLAESKLQLTGEIQDVSQNFAGDVDEWIAQARKLQDDIARCKIEARNIVEEHERGETIRSSVRDAHSKVQLLETEIAFTKALEHEMQNVAEVTQVFNEINDNLADGEPVLATGKLVSLQAAIEHISASQTRSLLTQLNSELRERSQKQLEQSLASQWEVKRSEAKSVLTARSDTGPNTTSDVNAMSISIDSALSALSDLQALPSATAIILRTVESFILPIISSKSPPYASSANVQGGDVVIVCEDAHKNVHSIIAVLQVLLQFLHEKLPEQIRDNMVPELLLRIITSLISVWLNPSLPYELHDLQQLDSIQAEVTALAAQLQQYSWLGDMALHDWIQQIPQCWLAKRKMASLDAVRKAFSMARGPLRPIERVERQKVAIEEPKGSPNMDTDWNADWDDEPQQQEKTGGTETMEEDVSGWDFDAEDDKPDPANEPQAAENGNEDDDAGDAWGWGDDEENTKEEPRVSKTSLRRQHRQTNGETSISNPSGVEEMILTETYYITDIPDYILETVGKDMADSHELQRSASRYFNTTSPASGLTGLPNLVLSLFRAIAPTYYALPSKTYTLSNINLYNDTLYLIQRLNESPDALILEPSIKSLAKFARQIYSAELDVQRTVLLDLLDGAQGFERCTTFPNSQACADAVSSITDRFRQLHKEWSSILGESHLLQSLGSLMTTIFGKIIKDIEDIEDISEAESKQLVTYCQQILSLEDLFSSQLPDLMHGQSTSSNTAQQDQPKSSQIVLYVPNYLRFQYLQQILESSLVDIKYLWTEGELSLEFSVDEVVDLIKALFAESQHRRGAIRDIKGSVNG